MQKVENQHFLSSSRKRGPSNINNLWFPAFAGTTEFLLFADLSRDVNLFPRILKRTADVPFNYLIDIVRCDTKLVTDFPGTFH